VIGAELAEKRSAEGKGAATRKAKRHQGEGHHPQSAGAQAGQAEALEAAFALADAPVSGV
jgi:hypothetical protein